MKILLIDDCAAKMKSMFHDFAEMFYAESEKEAVEILSVQKIDAILMDGSLGLDLDTFDEISGIDVVVRLRKAGFTMKIIMFSSSDENNEKGMLAGANGIFNKRSARGDGWREKLNAVLA